MNSTETKDKPLIAYFVSEFPSRSHTFIRRERDALRKEGVNVTMLAIRKCAESTLKSPEERRDYADTWAILPIKIWTLMTMHWRLCQSNPRRYFKTLKIALKHRHPGLRNALWALFHFSEAGVLATQLHSLDATHLHVHFANAGASIAYLAHHLTQLPWSMTLHGACDFEYPAGPLLKDKLESVKRAVFVSQYGVSQAMRVVSPHHWRKFTIVRCGIEPSQLISYSELPRKFEGPPVIYSIGRLSNEKGQLGLLEAFTLLFKKLPDAQLKIIGDGPDKQQLLDHSIKLGIADRVSWIGAIPEQEVIAHLREYAHALALPSFMEGIPLVLMEAMGNGVPVIAPRIAGIPELIAHHIHGLLYHPADWSQLADRLYEVLTNTPLQQTLTINAWKKVDAAFRVDTATTSLAEFFQDTDSEVDPEKSAITH